MRVSTTPTAKRTDGGVANTRNSGRRIVAISCCRESLQGHRPTPGQVPHRVDVAAHRVYLQVRGGDQVDDGIGVTHLLAGRPPPRPDKDRHYVHPSGGEAPDVQPVTEVGVQQVLAVSSEYCLYRLEEPDGGIRTDPVRHPNPHEFPSAVPKNSDGLLRNMAVNGARHNSVQRGQHVRAILQSCSEECTLADDAVVILGGQPAVERPTDGRIKQCRILYRERISQVWRCEGECAPGGHCGREVAPRGICDGPRAEKREPQPESGGGGLGLARAVAGCQRLLRERGQGLEVVQLETTHRQPADRLDDRCPHRIGLVTVGRQARKQRGQTLRLVPHRNDDRAPRERPIRGFGVAQPGRRRVKRGSIAKQRSECEQVTWHPLDIRVPEMLERQLLT